MRTPVIACLMRCLASILHLVESLCWVFERSYSSAGLLIVAVLPLMNRSARIARCQKERFFLIVCFESVSYHRTWLMQFAVFSHYSLLLVSIEHLLAPWWLLQNVIDLTGGVLWVIRTLLLLRLMKRLLRSGLILSIFPHRRRTRINEPLNHSALS